MRVLLFWMLLVGVSGAVEERSPTVGMVGRVEGVELLGEELVAAPIVDDTVPLVLRIVETYPRASGFVYDMEFYGLDPGEYNLVDYLKPKEGGALTAGELAAVVVQVRSVLPPGQVEPRELVAEELVAGFGYLGWLIAGGVIWVCVLGWLIFGWRAKKEEGREGEEEIGLSLAERLRPVVEKARDGELSTAEQAKLERLLLAFWREKLGLVGAAPEEAMAALRADGEAGELLRQMEVWLHQPEGAGGEVDVAKLLEPYRDAPGGEEVAG